MKTNFRFENLEIWQRAAEIAIRLDEVAEQLDEKKKYRFAEQLRAAALSISNNIAEGSGSNSNKDFLKYLYIARKSAFECASMLLVFTKRQYLTEEQAAKELTELETIGRMIVNFAKTL